MAIFETPNQHTWVYFRLYAETIINSMTKSVFLAMLALCMALTGVARSGYHVDLNLATAKDSTVYLMHYYGKPLPTIYKLDSARTDKNGHVVFESKDTNFVGGIYMILLADHKTYFEFLLNAGDNFSITADLANLPTGLTFTNSPENDHYLEYAKYLNGYSARQMAIQKEFATAKSGSDSMAAREKAATASKDLAKYRRELAKKYPHTLLASIFHALESPQVPDGPHYLADGVTKDSLFGYNYYKKHFWDSYDLHDDRLLHTPIYEARLTEYMTKLVYPFPDSVIAESKMLLARTRGTKEVFKYTLWWLTKNAENSKVMGMDEVFVYLVENYYMKGDANWLSTEELNKYIERALKIAPNVIGNLSPEIKLSNLKNGKEESLSAFDAKYTLLVFYAPSCGHCKTEMPAIDSVYRARLKKKGVRIFAVSTEYDEAAAKDFVKTHKLDSWLTTWDPEHIGDWRSKFDVYSTPSIYLLDNKKIIKGKRLDHTNVASLVDMLEEKKNN